MADNSGGGGSGGGGLYFVVGALVVLVGVIGFVAFGGHMPHGGGGPSKVELQRHDPGTGTREIISGFPAVFPGAAKPPR